MQYSTVYDLNLPTHIARVLVSKIEHSMQNTRAHCTDLPSPAVFELAGVLRLENVLFFQSLDCTVLSDNVREPLPHGENTYYSKKFDPDASRMRVLFTVWQELPNL